MIQSSPGSAGDGDITSQAPPYVRAISPYRPGRPLEDLARDYGLQAAAIVRLAANENPLGVPASAVRAMIEAVPGLGRYPDSSGLELKRALAEKFRVPAEWITLGNGSNDILEMAARAFLRPGQSVVYAQHSFAVFAMATQVNGARHIVVPARDLGHDLDAMAGAIAGDTRIVFIANPNNPTGTFLPAADIDAFLRRIPTSVAVVLDEAYNEYLPPDLRADSTEWLRRHPNLIISRTFSKVYGLAGLRVGYGLAQAGITDLMNRVRQPFNVGSLALVAARAALSDKAFLQESFELNCAGLRQLQSAFDAMGLQYVPSHANFVLVRVGDAAGVHESLLRAGVVVRRVDSDGLPEWLRVTVGLRSENEAFLRALQEALARR